MKVMNWQSVLENTPFEKLPAGGYVVTITDVKDFPNKEYLQVVYDIKEGEHAGFYSDDWARRNPWAHALNRSYKEKALGMFKAFLTRLEESNPGRFNIEQWQVRSNEKELIGLELGVVLQTEYYTSDSGDDKERLTDVGVYASQDIRNGDYKLPAPKDKRTQVSSTQAYVSQSPMAASTPTSYSSNKPAAQYASQMNAPAQGGQGSLYSDDSIPF